MDAPCSRLRVTRQLLVCRVGVDVDPVLLSILTVLWDLEALGLLY